MFFTVSYAVESEQVSEQFSIKLTPRWSDIDANRHMRHSAYADFGAQARMAFFEAAGYNHERFESLMVGPILFREELIYRREIGLGEDVVVDVRIAGLSAQGDRWAIEHRLFKPGEVLAAKIIAEGAWLDLKQRKLVVPPPELAQAFQAMPRSESFQEIKRG